MCRTRCVKQHCSQCLRKPGSRTGWLDHLLNALLHYFASLYFTLISLPKQKNDATMALFLLLHSLWRGGERGGSWEVLLALPLLWGVDASPSSLSESDPMFSFILSTWCCFPVLPSRPLVLPSPLVWCCCPPPLGLFPRTIFCQKKKFL